MEDWRERPEGRVLGATLLIPPFSPAPVQSRGSFQITADCAEEEVFPVQGVKCELKCQCVSTYAEDKAGRRGRSGFIPERCLNRKV
jgi:hypothetical protein